MAMDFDYYFDVMYDTGPLPLKKDTSYTTTGTCLLEAMKLVDEVEKTLLMKKKDFKMKLKILKFKMNIVENKQTQLKETMVKFNKFVQENDYKRLRAEAKIEGERQTINALTQDMNTAQLQLIELGNFKKKLLRWTKEKQIYFDFMQQVHQRTTYDFPELRHIIARKETLLAIQEELVSRISTGMDGCETVKNALKKYVEDQHLVFIHLNLELTSQKEKREQIKQSIYDSNNQQNELASKILGRAADLKKIMLCLSNIWEQMQIFESQQNVPKPATLGLSISFVPVIVKFLLFLSSVVARIKKDLASLPPPLPPCD